MNILVAKKVGGVFQKVGVRYANKLPDGGFPSCVYNLFVNADFYFSDEPAAVSFDIILGGDEFRVSKF